MAVVIQFRHDDAAVWTAENPILAEGEVGAELDTGEFKIGNGVTAWNSLPYANRQGEKGDKGDQGDRGIQGLKGDQGDEGAAATIAVGTVTPVANGTPSTVTNVGTPAAAIFDFELEAGEKGDEGDAATIAIGTVASVPSGTTPTVVNGGTPAAAVFNFQLEAGIQGIQGVAGISVLNGAGAPGAELGVNGDLYIDTTAHAIYGPKAGGAWGSPTTLIGPQGIQGIQGIAGFTVLNGAGVPGVELGVNGDFCIDTTAHNIYGPKTAGGWGGGVSLVGPQGIQGTQGGQGEIGPQGAGNLAYEGGWVTATLYHVDDILKGADSLFYHCTTQHTSGATTAPGVGADWGTVWELFGGGGGGGDFLVMQVFS